MATPKDANGVHKPGGTSEREDKKKNEVTWGKKPKEVSRQGRNDET